MLCALGTGTLGIWQRLVGVWTSGRLARLASVWLAHLANVWQTSRSRLAGAQVCVSLRESA
eukprot:883638-Prymnesium_polylepis.1